MIEVSDQAHLESLPDGTIIRWRRIPGDPTSEAVAFLRVETETAAVSPEDGRPFDVTRTVWVSPGGWHPMSVEEAGITYPCEVVMLPAPHTESCHRTDHHPEITYFDPPTDDPDKLSFTYGGHDMRWPTMTGGTWAREKALECAARVRAGDAANAANYVTANSVLALAEAFEAWLNRPVADDEQPLTMLGTDGVTRVPIDPQSDYQRLHNLANEMDWANAEHGQLRTVSTTALRHYANCLES